MKIGIVVGTRPEIIKMAPVIRECQGRKVPFVLIHSNQHYSKDMDEIFFDELELPRPHYNLNIGSSKGHANQSGNILIKIEPILQIENPDVLLVQGDTNTVMASALAASKLGIKLGHIEAGLRSYDKTMPEETNRVITDHMSDYLFAVTNTQRDILLQEGIYRDKVHVVGNTIVDTLHQNIKKASGKSKILQDLCLQPKEYILLTAHRSSNVDTKQALVELIDCLSQVCEYSVVWPIHPRTLNNLKKYALELPPNIIQTSPLGYYDFLHLLNNAKLAVTDSGGVQEESCILSVPCVTIRENTERPETIEVGGNILVGRDKIKFCEAINYFLSVERVWECPFGDGTTSKRILDVIQSIIYSEKTINDDRKISVLGMGYMGLPTASLLSVNGYEVTGVDVNQNKVNRINSGNCPFDELGMADLLRLALERGLRAATEVQESDVYIIAVPTPATDQKCDLTYVKSAAESISKVAKDGQIVILESTVSPGVCDELLRGIFDNVNVKIGLAHCPERAIPGNTLNEIINNDRVIGADTEATYARVKKIYSNFVRGEIFQTNCTTAETVKLLENTYRDVNIALANEFSDILLNVGVKPTEAIALANRHPRVEILNPGIGVGGHCIAIDPHFLMEKSTEVDLIKVARNINHARPSQIAEKMLKEHKPSKVGLLGLSYKKNVDDDRHSPSYDFIRILREKGVEVKAYDPYVSRTSELHDLELDSFESLQDWADLLVIAVEHDLFSELNMVKPTYNACKF